MAPTGAGECIQKVVNALLPCLFHSLTHALGTLCYRCCCYFCYWSCCFSSCTARFSLSSGICCHRRCPQHWLRCLMVCMCEWWLGSSLPSPPHSLLSPPTAPPGYQVLEAAASLPQLSRSHSQQRAAHSLCSSGIEVRRPSHWSGPTTASNMPNH